MAVCPDDLPVTAPNQRHLLDGGDEPVEMAGVGLVLVFIARGVPPCWPGTWVGPYAPCAFLSTAARFTKYHRVSTSWSPSFSRSARLSRNSLPETMIGGSE